MNTPELREQCAQRLLAGTTAAGRMTAFVGLDGFVDEIIRVVDKRESLEKFTFVPTIARLADKLAAAAGKSANMQLLVQLVLPQLVPQLLCCCCSYCCSCNCCCCCFAFAVVAAAVVGAAVVAVVGAAVLLLCCCCFVAV